ncbi:MAG: hypothetical protein RL546_800 [Chloroflexota bacterium]
MDRLRVGVIGLGEIGGAHCASIATLPQATLVAVADLRSDVAAKVAATYGATAYATAEELLAHPDLDAVIIALPDHLHRAAAEAAAAAGKAMLVEKPLAVDAEDARAIVRAADAAKVFLMVGFTVRYFPQYLRARQAVESGELGTIVSAFARRVNVVTQTDRIAGRVGVLHFLGVHDFDALRWVMGDEVASVHCVSATSAPLAHNVEHETFTTLTFKKGAIACVQAGWYLPTTHPAGFDFRLDLTGRDGSLNLSMMEQGIAIHGRSGTSYPYMASPLIAEDRDFVDRVLAGAPSPITGADGLAAGAIVDAALESIATGRVIQL